MGRQAPSCEGVSGRLKAWRLESPPGAPSPTLRAHFARPCDSLGAGGRGAEQAFEGSLHIRQADCVSPEARPSMGGSLWWLQDSHSPVCPPKGNLAPAGWLWEPGCGAGRAHRLPAQG